MDRSLHFAVRIFFFSYNKRKKKKRRMHPKAHKNVFCTNWKDLCCWLPIALMLLLLLLLSRNLNLVHGEWGLEQFATIHRYSGSGSYIKFSVSVILHSEFENGTVKVFVSLFLPVCWCRFPSFFIFDVGCWWIEINP